MADIYQEAAETIVKMLTGLGPRGRTARPRPSMRPASRMFAAANFNTTKSRIAWNVARACNCIIKAIIMSPRIPPIGHGRRTDEPVSAC